MEEQNDESDFGLPGWWVLLVPIVVLAFVVNQIGVAVMTSVFDEKDE